MANDVILPGAGTPVESLDIGGGTQRQVMTISPRDLSADDSIGPLTEVAPVTDTGSSGLNGRLQRIAQRITSMIGALLPTLAGGAALVSGTTPAMAGVAPIQVIAAVAGERLYITRVKCINSGGIPTLVQITDGEGGAVLETLAGGSNFGGEQGTGSTPLFWTTAGNGLFAQDVTTGASVIVTASGYSG
jgi:hypothetical protein